MTNLENSKQNLLHEFESMPHTRRDLLGNAACARKIRELIIANILNKVKQSTCVDELNDLMVVELGVLEEDFKKEILPLIDTFYKAKKLIDCGYCNELYS